MADELKWFTKSADAAKGPFDLAAIRGSIAAGRLGPKTQVRREDEHEWQLIGVHPELNKVVVPAGGEVAFRRPFDERADTVVFPGSFGLGFAAGFFGGCIGWVLCEVLAKGTETKKGARIGFAVQACVGIFLRVVAAGK